MGNIGLIIWGLLFAAVSVTRAQIWTQTGAPYGANAIASSADGSKLVSVINNRIYVSTNSGATWVSNSVPAIIFKSVASSADGTRLVTAGPGSGIYVSTNSGIDWQLTSAPTTNEWSSVASSADGTKLVAVAGLGIYAAGPSYTSTDSGATWISNNVPVLSWNAVASSADGTKLVAVGSSPPSIYTSTNSGTTWTANNTINYTDNYFYWQSVASSADGTKLVILGASEPAIHLSTDSGATWATSGTPGLYWNSVASSADGMKLVAVEEHGGIYTSTNAGLSWISNSVPIIFWDAVASSADGSKLVAGTNPGGISNFPQGVYASVSTPAPQLNVTPANGSLAISWIVPSANFALQHNNDLATTNWLPWTNAPRLNLTNLQEEVFLSSSNNGDFFRLASP